MFPKALWMKEWKHTKTVSFGLLIVFVLAYPVSAVFMMDSWRSLEKRSYWGPEQLEYEINQLFSGEIYSVIAAAIIILLAGFLIGLEKNTKRHDFMMALPYSRTQMYLTKYLYGLFTIILTYSFSFTLGYLVVATSEYHYLLEHVSFFNAIVSPFLLYFVTFSLAILVGTFTGEIKSQIILTIFFFIFPQAFALLLGVLADIHDWDAERLFENEFIYQDIFWGRYASIGLDHNLMYPLIFGIIFTLLGWLCFKSTRSEYSGEFLMFRGLHPVFAVLLPTFMALVGGFLVGSFVPFNSGEGMRIAGYWIGFLVALFFAWKMTKRLLRR